MPRRALTLITAYCGLAYGTFVLASLLAVCLYSSACIKMRLLTRE